MSADVEAGKENGLTSELGHEVYVCAGVVLQLVGLDHDVAGIAKGSVHAGRRNRDTSIWQGETLPLLPRSQDHGRIAECIPDRKGVDLWPNVVEGIQNGICLRLKAHRSPKRVLRANGIDVHVDWLVWGRVIEPQELRNHELCDSWDQLHITQAQGVS